MFSAVKGDGRINLFSRRPLSLRRDSKKLLERTCFLAHQQLPDGIHDRLRVVPQVLCSGHVLDEAFMQVVPLSFGEPGMSFPGRWAEIKTTGTSGIRKAFLACK